MNSHFNILLIARTQIEELKSSPDIAEASAPALVAQELDRDLNGATSGSMASKQVNDLTSMVVKKKKTTSEPTEGKRKADGDIVGSPEKKSKVAGGS